MALDVYVMPLWRFKAGYFETALEEKLGCKVTFVSPQGLFSLPNRWRRFRSFTARREVRAVRKAVTSQVGQAINWRDDGGVLYSERPPGFEDLRAYGKWLDHRDEFPEFLPPPDRDFYKHPVRQLADKPNMTCPQLVNHDCYSGYYLPCEFDTLAEVEPYEMFGRTFTRSVGSSFRLRDELQALNEHLKLDIRDWSERESEAVGWVKIDGRTFPDDPMYYVKWGLQILHDASRISCEHGLPIIFWG